MQTELEPHWEEWEESGLVPRDVIKRCAQQGFFAASIGHWPEKYFPKVLCGVELEKADTFCEFIFIAELSMATGGGPLGPLSTSTSIGLPPLISFGSDYIKEKYVKDCLTGEKVICLAITEPWAGSDVASLKTTAVKSECGKFYIVNGMKKWITAGIYSDLFTTCVRTSDNGMFGLSLLVIEKQPGLSIRKIKTQGASSSGSSFLVFDNVKVPVENLIGNEGEGFKYVMSNFNHERLVVCMTGICSLRSAVHETMVFAHKRKTFGKRLIDHPVIRLKIANMVRLVESAQAYLEQIIYNFDRMTKKEINKILAGQIALLKA